ncbi:2-oxoglutarate dehydrogenase E1 component [Candidatus Finniella inopinata]|uniref:2-oxoglutarate dehydrogenase E1 component n=1 Tax=Candidatus Finniella inopinata TaxID=1696036 RepID=A0A4Q7DJF2_9PROT|nr:2-oxoglutarate dehydrogenase E1 component [Candidatus Finniella inopinata]RZI46448.1 2-oxoglutarate dehydrogenase E1 component [Candidatus Finniella inopinata]
MDFDRYRPETLLTQTNRDYLIGLYQEYKKDPASVSKEWQQWFQEFPLEDIVSEQLPTWPKLPDASISDDHATYAYRQWGHILAKLDPLGLENPKCLPDLQTPHNLEKIYSQTIGLEFMHVENKAERLWLQDQFENRMVSFTDSQKLGFFDQLQKTELLEKFLQTKFPGAKRFSIEGNDTLIPALEHSLGLVTQRGTKTVVIGMAHRGRLSVMAHILKKPLPLIFGTFNDRSPHDDFPGSGDVKYHQGYQSQRDVNGQPLDLTILSNPSHLESIVPIAMGRARSLQGQNNNALAILIHGDGAFSGQGIVYESLQLSQLPGYQVGGSLHIILNNQIGFTTTAQEGRSTRYCTDVAKAMGCPIVHVNADDVEMVVWAFEMAIQYRYQFHKDIVIDLVGYRRHGHNEGDEPSYTQPVMYKAIAEKLTVSSLYGQQLKDQGLSIPDQEAYRKTLQEGLKEKPDWKLPSLPLQAQLRDVDLTTLKKLGLVIHTVPNNFQCHSKLERILVKRREQIENEKPLDWATAESLAFASLLDQGNPVRLVGQDTKRGTFSQRHGEWVDMQTNAPYIPLKSLGAFECINSPLSEAAALGFEYGYSLALKGLKIWEAQFGDFVNGAQVIIDQYISAAYGKWLQPSNLVLLLPHGYEGQGPEHSSTRLERFLQLSAEENWRVAVCSTPANYFHLLRQQVESQRPLIALTPKSLLRNPETVSLWNDFGDIFHPVIDDPFLPAAQAEKIIFCTGKVYYDLAAHRQQRQDTKTAIVRLEQLYPFPGQELADLLRNSQAKTWVWCQEEPQNMGAWSFVAPLLKALNPDVTYAGRPSAASPATGFAGRHAREQAQLVEAAFN